MWESRCTHILWVPRFHRVSLPHCSHAQAIAYSPTVYLLQFTWDVLGQANTYIPAAGRLSTCHVHTATGPKLRHDPEGCSP